MVTKSEQFKRSLGPETNRDGMSHSSISAQLPSQRNCESCPSLAPQTRQGRKHTQRELIECAQHDRARRTTCDQPTCASLSAMFTHNALGLLMMSEAGAATREVIPEVQLNRSLHGQAVFSGAEVSCLVLIVKASASHCRWGE